MCTHIGSPPCGALPEFYASYRKAAPSHMRRRSASKAAEAVPLDQLAGANGACSSGVGTPIACTLEHASATRARRGVTARAKKRDTRKGRRHASRLGAKSRPPAKSRPRAASSSALHTQNSSIQRDAPPVTPVCSSCHWRSLHCSNVVARLRAATYHESVSGSVRMMSLSMLTHDANCMTSLRSGGA